MQINRVGGGYCAGKTITYANLNDSSGAKKSKRRSKEERKQMVQTFIQRHQASNKGSFPSLNLTHKEVGGSYYIVREIFRDIIQENRVLAPPKLPPGEENMENLDSFLENFPLGSISFDPNIHGVPPKDNKTLLNEYELRRAKVLNTKRVSELHRRKFDDGIIINSSTNATENNEVFEEPEHAEFVMEQGVEGHEHEVNEVDVYQGHIRPLSKNVVVETFPLRPVSSMIFDEVVNTKSEELATPQTESKTIMDVEFENKALSTPSDISSKHNSSSSLQQPSFEALTANKKKSGLQPTDTAKRINLESLEAAKSKRSDSQESNPIMSFIKTCVATFMKLWSE
ncbi:uncharacterized protein [Rutidosis leptorrhynchoides]|uniref:uncharacterized protein n=1 Tax=Rutidosis leptorrhynchoides TaxID=125765 RepID=UPI003A99C18C